MTDSPELLDLLSRWLPEQRWFPARGREVTLSEVGRVDYGGTDDVTVIGHLIGVQSAAGLEVVQVPLTYRAEPLPDVASLGLIGGCAVHDGPHDPVFVDCLLSSLTLADGQGPIAAGHGSSVLTGEQSNTSIIVGPASDRPVMVKIFRLLNAGRNPDVEVIGALAAAGCREVPALVGWSEGTWDTAAGAAVTGDLSVATEFLTGSQDAWRVALEAATAGTDFTDQARDLGAATAQVHVKLREVLGDTPADPRTTATLVEGLQHRVTWALDNAPALAPHREALESHREALGRLAGLPGLQRIHGDYHLGQVLHSPTRGWVLLDFEGEPLRPIAERTLPDLAIRDVVGMLRSFDYAAGHVAITSPQRAQVSAGWAERCRKAFLQGYAAVAGTDPAADTPDLYRALWLDKALYEVVYETRNRPEWVSIPLAAVAAQITKV